MVALNHDLGRGSSSLTDRICDLLREQIISFELKPFHAISDKKLAEQIGVSRTPVREALARLASQRLIDIYPQRGTVVSPLRRVDLERSQFIREVLEVGLVQRVAALESRGELIRKLRTEVALQETFGELGDDGRLYSSDEDFHRLIATYAGLPGIWEDIAQSKLHMDRCRHLTLATVEKDIRIITDQHNAIIDAIEQGDPKSAADAMRFHLRRILKFIDQLVEIHPEYFDSASEARSAMKADAHVARTG